MAQSGRSVAFFTITSLRRLVDSALFAAIFVPIILFGLQFSHSPKLDELWLTARLRQYGDPTINWMGSWVGVAWPSAAGSKSLFPLAVAFVVWLGKIAVDAVFLRGHRLFTKPMPAPQSAGEAADGHQRAVEGGPISADSERAREELLKRYREIESALKTSKRKRCTFLSIDVMGSTQMKVGERETEIAATFQAYSEMLRGIFDQYGSWKVAWTPDGVMVCFLQPDLAVGAGQRILKALKRFNESENRLRTPFRVRCGMNMGEVPIFEDSRLEKVADHVIDVAGHMQKQSAPNSLWLSDEVLNALADKTGFRPTGQTVDGFEVFEWTEPSLEPADKATG